MTKPVRFGSLVTIAVLASLSVGCAAPQSGTRLASSATVKDDQFLALRAAAALNSSDFATAVTLAERAVQKTPDDARIRALLGNAYFGTGRFASAEAAFKDSLYIESNQPNVILKLVLVEIAQGKNAEALNFLQAGEQVLDPADYGLALALAGRPEAGVAALQPTARSAGADARVRENLALAYALAGDWNNARVVAGQDVPADQLDARMHQWMQLASPQHASDQVAALIGVRPAASDPGQPVQLALRKSDTMMAATAPVRAPGAVAAAPVQPSPELPVVAADPAPPQLAAVDAMPAPAPAPAPAPEAAPVVEAPISMAQAAIASPEAPAMFAAMIRKAPLRAAARKPAPLRVASASAPAPRFAGVRNGRAAVVVQIGAYSRPQAVNAAWSAAARRFGGLRNYSPMSARFVSARGPVYRLAVRGFTSFREANALCGSLKRQGTGCFVRNFAGDAPVQIAMR